MSASAYAVLLLLPYFVLGQLIAHRGGLPTRRQILPRVGVFLAALAVWATIPIYMHCGTRGPTDVSYMGVLCAPLALLFVRPLWPATIATFSIFGLGMANDSIYYRVLSRPGVTEYTQARWQREQRIDLEPLTAIFFTADGKFTKTYPAGYLDELRDKDVQEALNDFLQSHSIEDVRVTNEWHTPLTGLRRKETRPARIWFEGGRLDRGPSAFSLVGVGRFTIEEKEPTFRIQEDMIAAGAKSVKPSRR